VKATPHFRRPHPELDLAASPFFVNTEPIDFPGSGTRIAGVSSIGLGGTDAHVVLSQPPAGAADPPTDGWRLIPLSAAVPTALRQLAGRLADALTVAPAGSLGDVGYTMTVGRRRMPHRAAVLARDVAGAIEGLTAVATGRPSPIAVEGAPADLVSRAEAWLHGLDLPAGDGRRMPLPTYPFQRERHWIDLPVEAPR